MAEILVWVSFADSKVIGTIALRVFDSKSLEGKRAPGGFKIDPLGLGMQDMNTLSRGQPELNVKEAKNGHLQVDMLAIIGGIP